MQFKDLSEIIREIDTSIRFFGATKELYTAWNNFRDVMRGKYTGGELNNPSFLERNVPKDVKDAFMPIYDMYRDHHRRLTGQELAPLPG